MTVFIVMESWYSSPYEIVRIYSKLEEARYSTARMVRLDTNNEYHYIIETHEVY